MQGEEEGYPLPVLCLWELIATRQGMNYISNDPLRSYECPEFTVPKILQTIPEGGRFPTACVLGS